MSVRAATGWSREERIGIDANGALATAIRTPGATVLLTGPVPDSPMLNRVVGLGVARTATETDIDAAIAAIPPGVTYYVALAAHARPAQLPDWLRARGLQPGWGWTQFARDPGDAPPSADTELRLVRVADARERAAFGRIVRTGFELPAAFEPVVAAAPGHGWECWLALDGDEPAAAGALFASGGAAYLGLCATLPEQRGKGAQSALLARRIRRAAELGCDAVVTETGELRDDRPSRSYRNIRRAGFAEVGRTANWVGRS